MQKCSEDIPVGYHVVHEVRLPGATHITVKCAFQRLEVAYKASWLDNQTVCVLSSNATDAVNSLFNEIKKKIDHTKPNRKGKGIGKKIAGTVAYGVKAGHNSTGAYNERFTDWKLFLQKQWSSRSASSVEQSDVLQSLKRSLVLCGISEFLQTVDEVTDGIFLKLERECPQKVRDAEATTLLECKDNVVNFATRLRQVDSQMSIQHLVDAARKELSNDSLFLLIEHCSLLKYLRIRSGAYQVIAKRKVAALVDQGKLCSTLRNDVITLQTEAASLKETLKNSSEKQATARKMSTEEPGLQLDFRSPAAVCILAHLIARCASIEQVPLQIALTLMLANKCAPLSKSLLEEIPMPSHLRLLIRRYEEARRNLLCREIANRDIYLMFDGSNKAQKERLSLYFTWCSEDQLRATRFVTCEPPQNSSAEQIARSVANSMDKCQIAPENVAGACLDNCSVNMGHSGGAAAILAQLVQDKLQPGTSRVFVVIGCWMHIVNLIL